MISLKQQRVLSKIKEKNVELGLDLTGYNILTEVGSGEYVYTPIIAALANANKIVAYTKDSRYGKASDIIERCRIILKGIGLADKVEFYSDEVSKEHLENADIITNSGFLRPLNKEKLQYLKKNAVIPLMYEKWELRDSDIDIDYCKLNKIRVAGTWENHPDLLVFNHVGPLAVKMSLNAGYEVYNNKIIVWSDDHFGEVAKKAFLSLGAKEVILTTNQDFLYKNIENVDFIYVCDYDEKREYGSADFFDFKKLLKLNPDFGIVHLYGNINYNKHKDSITTLYPSFDGFSSIMTYTLSHIGINPLINLQISGFKVAESLHENISCEFAQIIK
ncbi:hypothetical protein [Patiriisocius sp. Uisw_017]|uniref:hypothetical protein n=1 Tax=Patiriisocius sp. Uisw_017 TaxID=3230968 RepID=UPI0039E87BD2